MGSGSVSDYPTKSYAVPGRIDVHIGLTLLFGLMPPKFIPHLLVVSIFVSSGCTRPVATAEGLTAEAYVSDSGSVGFNITPLKGPNGSLRLEASYESRGRLAKFAIEFGPTHNMETKDSKDFLMKTGQGRFLSETGSDSTVLLADLQKALEAKTIPTKPKRVQALPFTFVNLGDNLSQARGGGFSTNPRGGWTAIKVFMGEEDQEGEMFVNFNQAIGKGQFSIKDADYGDPVLKQLATVL
jgi:hypothetical protein